MSFDNLPRAAWGSANAPSAIAFVSEDLRGKLQTNINIYKGELTLLDSFAMSVLAGAQFDWLRDPDEPLEDKDLDLVTTEIWAISASMLRTRPLPPAQPKNGGAS